MILMLSVRLAGTIHTYFDAYAPTNIFIRRLRARGCQWLAFPVSGALAIGYGLLGSWLTSIIDSGGYGWLNPLALLCAWNMIKFAWVAVAYAARRVLVHSLRSRQRAKARACAPNALPAIC